MGLNILYRCVAAMKERARGTASRGLAIIIYERPDYKDLAGLATGSIKSSRGALAYNLLVAMRKSGK